MQKKYFISFLVFIVFLAAANRGEAFVPQTPHLLHLMVKKIRVPAGMTVVQTRKIATAATVADAQTADIQVSSETALEETLTYLFPEHLRSDLRLGSGNQFYVASGKGFVKVLNGEITKTVKSPGEYYTDPLLYRDHELLAQVLADAGINVEKVSLQRLDGNICWFIGDPGVPAFGDDEGKKPSPGLWIGKDSFFPVRYLIRKSGRTMDIRYDGWHKISRSWYPRETRILVDGEFFVHISVGRVELTPGLARNLFDVEKILVRYPRKAEGDQGRTDRDPGLESLDRELDKEIDTFNKLYD